MKKIIKQILKEDRQEQFLNKIILFMKDDFPFFKNMKDYGFTEQLSDDEYRYIMNKIFGEPVKRRGYDLFNKNGHNIYKEYENGYWEKYQYHENGLKTYTEDSKGRWYKTDYIYDINQKTIESITMDKYGLYERIMNDENGNILYYEDSYGDWEKYGFDENDNVIYHENSDGYWEKSEYDEYGYKIYVEDSYGFWEKNEFDENGNQIYFENSDGVIYDHR